jgi:hypothetical protein
MLEEDNVQVHKIFPGQICNSNVAHDFATILESLK